MAYHDVGILQNTEILKNSVLVNKMEISWCIVFAEKGRNVIRYDTIAEFNVDSKAEYSALSSTRSQKKKLKQTTPVPL